MNQADELYSVSGSEWRWLLIWAAVIVAITCLPAVIGWRQTPADWRYTGLVINPGDGNTYLNKMKQGADGQWLFTIAYTSEPHQPVFLHHYYILLGPFSRIAGLPVGLTFQLFRALNSYLLLLLVYLFMAQFWPEQAKRRIGFFFVALASGLGWLFVFFNISTTDLNVPESVTFLTMLVNPHFPLATAIILLSLMWGVRALHRRSWIYAIPAGLGQSALLLLHPYDIVITGATLAIYFLLGWLVHKQWSWPALIYPAVGWLICLPALLHNLRLYLLDGVWRLWQTQSPPPTPPFIAFALGYGILLLLAAVGGVAIFRQGSHYYRGPIQLALIWCVGIFGLMFAPLPPVEAIQVRFSEGLHIPVTVLAVEGLFYLTAKIGKRAVPRAIVWLPLLFVLSLTNGLILAGSIWRVTSPETPWFYTRDEISAMQWLDAHSRPDEVVLSLEWTGNHLPAQANVHVYVGHLYETINYDEKVEQARKFFNNRLTENEAGSFLTENSIDWVFVGRQETNSKFDPDDKPYLSAVFSAGETLIYRVEQP